MHKIDNPQWRLPNGLDAADVNQDGDLDIVANCEEYHDRDKVCLAVLWFENPLR